MDGWDQCTVFVVKKKGKGSFYIAQYPVRWTAQSASHFLPSLTDLFIPTPFSPSPGSILARQQLRTKTKSLAFPPLSIARYSFIQLSRQGRQWRERKMPNLRNGSKGDSNPGSLHCESGILPLSYCAPHVIILVFMVSWYLLQTAPSRVNTGVVFIFQCFHKGPTANSVSFRITQAKWGKRNCLSFET